MMTYLFQNKIVFILGCLVLTACGQQNAPSSSSGSPGSSMNVGSPSTPIDGDFGGDACSVEAPTYTCTLREKGNNNTSITKTKSQTMSFATTIKKITTCAGAEVSQEDISGYDLRNSLGLKAFWKGAFNGTTDASGENNPLNANHAIHLEGTASDQIYAFSASNTGNYSRSLVIYNNVGSKLCETNSLYITLQQ
jgi:hypothetical protein